MIDYYARVADVMLPHLRGRPITLRRFPEGVGKPQTSFFEKNCPKHRPEWVKTTPIYVDRRAGEIDFCMCQDLPTLTWMAQLAALELHPSLSKATRMEQPTVLAFDLDPGAPAGLVECCKVALRVRELFSAFDLDCFPKVSGGKGLQVYVPLNRKVSYEQTSPFAKAVAQLLEQQTPKTRHLDGAQQELWRHDGEIGLDQGLGVGRSDGAWILEQPLLVDERKVSRRVGDATPKSEIEAQELVQERRALVALVEDVKPGDPRYPAIRSRRKIEVHRDAAGQGRLVLETRTNRDLLCLRASLTAGRRNPGLIRAAARRSTRSRTPRDSAHRLNALLATRATPTAPGEPATRGPTFSLSGLSTRAHHRLLGRLIGAPACRPEDSDAEGRQKRQGPHGVAQCLTNVSEVCLVPAFR